jgi:serine phosphatase RsbU (regulator of sigma subunit)
VTFTTPVRATAEIPDGPLLDRRAEGSIRILAAIPGVLKLFVISRDGKPLLALPDGTALSAEALLRLRELAARAVPCGAGAADRLLARFDHHLLIGHRMAAFDIWLIAEQTVNSSLIDVGLRSVHDRMNRRTHHGTLEPPSFDSGELPVIQGPRPPADSLPGKLLACYARWKQADAETAFWRILVSLDLKPDAMQPDDCPRLVHGLAQSLATHEQRDGFRSQAEVIYLTALVPALRAERSRLRRTVTLQEQGFAHLSELVCGDPADMNDARNQAQRLVELQARLSRETGGGGGEETVLRTVARLLDIRQQLSDAHDLAELFQPAEKRFRLGPVTLASYHRPADGCGGDWWQARALDDRRILLAVADATGHGLSAGLLVAMAKAAWDLTEQLDPGLHDDIRRLLTLMNLTIHRTARTQLLMSCTLALVDGERRTVTVANAGHSFAFLVRPRPGSENELSTLVSRGPQLGAVAAPEFELRSFPIAPGDSIVLYTDGMVECQDRSGAQFGNRRFRNLLRHSRGADLCQTIVDELQSFRQGHAPSDDETLIIATLEQ